MKPTQMPIFNRMVIQLWHIYITEYYSNENERPTITWMSFKTEFWVKEVVAYIPDDSFYFKFKNNSPSISILYWFPQIM